MPFINVNKNQQGQSSSSVSSQSTTLTPSSALASSSLTNPVPAPVPVQTVPVEADKSSQETNPDIKTYTNDLPPLPETNAALQDIDTNFEDKLNKLQDFGKDIFKDVPEMGEALPNLDRTLPTSDATQVELEKSNGNIADLSHKTVTLEDVLSFGISRKASDIHFSSGYRAIIRVDGKLETVRSNILTAEQVAEYAKTLLKGRNLDLDKVYEADLTYTFSNRRFRVNIFRQMGSYSIVMRIIPEDILSPDELDLPQVVKGFAGFPNGLVLLTGPTGSGKSTTIASILNLINLTTPKHIITLEDPVEFVYPKGVGLIDQREFGIDFEDWPHALRAVLRQDPDVVMIGEMRDLQTIESALQIAETGHLVFATLHTNGASESINRIIDVFGGEKQDQIRIQLSSVLRAVLSQRLLPTFNVGRKVATEVLISNPSVKNAIRDKKVYQIDNIIETSAEQGMLSMERSLVNLIKGGKISLDIAKSVSNKPAELDILMTR